MNAWEAKRRARLPEWRQRVIECRNSGMSVREWCAEQEICPKTYYRWEREALGIAGKQLVSSQEAGPQSSGHPTFAELPAPQGTRVPGEAAAATIYIGAVTVDIHAGASAEMIAAICKGLIHAE